MEDDLILFNQLLLLCEREKYFEKNTNHKERTIKESTKKNLLRSIDKRIKDTVIIRKIPSMNITIKFFRWLPKKT